MIGILLALQVNNWNEWGKDKLKEIELWISFFQILKYQNTELRKL